MSTLAEIEKAARALPREQKEELIHLLAYELRASDDHSSATLVPGLAGTLLLQAPPGSPPMTTGALKEVLAEFP